MYKLWNLAPRSYFLFDYLVITLILLPKKNNKKTFIQSCMVYRIGISQRESYNLSAPAVKGLANERPYINTTTVEMKNEMTKVQKKRRSKALRIWRQVSLQSSSSTSMTMLLGRVNSWLPLLTDSRLMLIVLVFRYRSSALLCFSSLPLSQSITATLIGGSIFEVHLGLVALRQHLQILFMNRKHLRKAGRSMVA